MSESKLVCSNITKNYKEKKVIQNLNLELEKGKIYGLIGRNGVGKTTLLSILSGQNPSTEGAITLDGENVWENPEALSRICFSRELNPLTGGGANNMRVKDYFYAASIYMPGWDKEYASCLVKEFELDSKARIQKMSKGMLSMVTIIIALASKAEFTFLDEPVAGLDVVMRETFYKVLLEEFSKSGRTFVISTHIIEEAADVFEEVILLKDGQVVLKENTQELMERAFHVSGKEEDVDSAVAGQEVYHPEKLGRSKGVTVLMPPGEVFKSASGAESRLSVQPMSLQQIFVALCGKEDEK